MSITAALLAIAVLAPAQAGAQEDPMVLVTAAGGGQMETVLVLLEHRPPEVDEIVLHLSFSRTRRSAPGCTPLGACDAISLRDGLAVARV